MSRWVGIEQLELSPHRPEKGIPRVSAQLLSQVRAHGPLNPVVVRPCGRDRYEILSNAETWLAVQRAGQHQVPIEVRDDIDDAEAAELLELADKGRSNPIAEAEAFLLRIDELGGRQKRGAIAQTAREEGRSRSYISHALRLLTLPNIVQDMLIAGALSAGHARALVSLPDRRRQIRLAHRVQRDALSVRQLEDLVSGRGTRTPPAKASVAERTQMPSENPDIRRLEMQVSELLGCPTFVDTDQGELVIRYMQDLEVLEGVLDRLGYAGH